MRPEISVTKARYKSMLENHQAAWHVPIVCYCNTCSYQSKQKYSLKCHKLSKHMGVKYICVQCDQASEKHCLKKHELSHHDVGYVCDNCSYILLTFKLIQVQEGRVPAQEDRTKVFLLLKNMPFLKKSTFVWEIYFLTDNRQF